MDTKVTPRWSDRDILVPNDLEQRQIFHLLKKGSSLTAWKRRLAYFQKWAEITENSVRKADNSGLLAADESNIRYQDYVDILKELAIYEEGVTRLAKGDKRVFLYSEAYAFFVRSRRQASYWREFWNRLNTGEIRGGEKTPYRDEFFKALDDFSNGGEYAGFSLEPRDLDEPANLSYDLWHPIFLPKLPYPDPLPELPKPPKREVIVPTGKPVPFSGIWEPLDLEDNQLTGVMNYLHGETKAPTYEQTFIDHTDEEYGYDCDIIDVNWRLLWRDDRYEDGTIPEEEKDYIFVCPVPEGVQNPFSVETFDYIEENHIPNPFLLGARRAIDSVNGGQPCPREGYWWSPAVKSGSRFFKKGEIMPKITSTEYAESYWLWGGEAEKK
jgi:hypothetical protein